MRRCAATARRSPRKPGRHRRPPRRTPPTAAPTRRRTAQRRPAGRPPRRRSMPTRSEPSPSGSVRHHSWGFLESVHYRRPHARPGAGCRSLPTVESQMTRISGDQCVQSEVLAGPRCRRQPPPVVGRAGHTVPRRPAAACETGIRPTIMSRSARLQRTGVKRLFQYRSAGVCAAFIRIWVARSDRALGDQHQGFGGRRRIGPNRLAAV